MRAYPPMMRTFLPRLSMSRPCETHSLSQDQKRSSPPLSDLPWGLRHFCWGLNNVSLCVSAILQCCFSVSCDTTNLPGAHCCNLLNMQESHTYTCECSDAFTSTSSKSCIWNFISWNSRLSEHIICIEINLKRTAGIETDSDVTNLINTSNSDVKDIVNVLHWSRSTAELRSEEWWWKAASAYYGRWRAPKASWAWRRSYCSSPSLCPPSHHRNPCRADASGLKHMTTHNDCGYTSVLSHDETTTTPHTHHHHHHHVLIL